MRNSKKLRFVLNSAVACCLIWSPLAQAQTKAAVTPGDTPSAFVRCDGQPNKPSTLGTIARLVAITAVVGLLLPEREAGDVKKRAKGKEGVAACDEALNGSVAASDGGRRIELILARAVHKLTLSDSQGAIADVRLAASDQPEMVATKAYGQSLGLTAMEIEARALVQLGRFDEASDLALAMGMAAPYDLINMRRAQFIMRLSRKYDAQRMAFYDQLVRVFPVGLADRARARDLAMDHEGAASDYLTQSQLYGSVPEAFGEFERAQAAISYRLAGKKALAEELLAEAKKGYEADKAAGINENFTGPTTEILDLYAILDLLERGDVQRARIMFTARSDWKWPGIGQTAELARRLWKGATKAEMDAIKMPTVDQILNDQLAEGRQNVITGAKEGEDHWAAFRRAFSDGAFAKFARNVWHTEKSRYLAKEDTPNWAARRITTLRDGDGMPSGYALILHAALLAKAQGKSGFMMMGNQKYIYNHHIRIGDPDDKAIFAPIQFNADKVIADLSPIIPKPVSRR